MIPLAFIQQWTTHAPWPDLRQVEQDLIISRALCDLFKKDELRNRIAFRGGTAINKLIFRSPLRYSEDIDLVQTEAAPIGSLIDSIRSSLAWLGNCTYSKAAHSTHLVYKFVPETGGDTPLRLKIEINTREHTFCSELKSYPFEVISDWYRGQADILSFEPEELFATKLRALLQRQKNRDLFDLNHGLTQVGLNCDRVVSCFLHYLKLEGNSISRANAEEIMLKKLNRRLIEDIAPLLPTGVRFDESDAEAAFGRVWTDLVQRIPGEAWKSTRIAVQSLRLSKRPSLLKGEYE